MQNTSWKLARALAIAALVLAGAGSAGANEDQDGPAQRIGSGDPVRGKARSATELCQGCHGEQGDDKRGAYPKLTGQYADYILKQLGDFKSGARKHEIMNSMASHVSEADAADIAAYFASNEQMKGDGAGANAVAQTLFAKGDVRRGILACSSCHGPAGKGAVSGMDIYPAIGGQYKSYLREQLRNWRSGARGPGHVMNIIAETLSDGEIEALSSYISGL